MNVEKYGSHDLSAKYDIKVLQIIYKYVSMVHVMIEKDKFNEATRSRSFCSSLTSARHAASLTCMNAKPCGCCRSSCATRLKIRTRSGCAAQRTHADMSSPSSRRSQRILRRLTTSSVHTRHSRPSKRPKILYAALDQSRVLGRAGRAFSLVRRRLRRRRTHVHIRQGLQ